MGSALRSSAEHEDSVQNMGGCGWQFKDVWSTGIPGPICATEATKLVVTKRPKVRQHVTHALSQAFTETTPCMRELYRTPSNSCPGSLYWSWPTVGQQLAKCFCDLVQSEVKELLYSSQRDLKVLIGEVKEELKEDWIKTLHAALSRFSVISCMLLLVTSCYCTFYYLLSWSSAAMSGS